MGGTNRNANEQLPLPPDPPAPPLVEARALAEEQLRHRELDRLCKSVMALDRGRCLRWLCGPDFCRLFGLPEAVPVLRSQLDKEFSDIKRIGDYLLEMAFAAFVVALHLEFQKRPDRHMGARQHRYQGAIRAKHGLPVLSLVLHVECAQVEPFRAEVHLIGPLSQTGWVSLSACKAATCWRYVANCGACTDSLDLRLRIKFCDGDYVIRYM